MTSYVELFVGLVPFLPALGAFTIPVIHMTTGKRRATFTYAVGVLAVTFLLTLIVAIRAFQDELLVFKAAGWPAPIGIVYVVDKFSAIVAVVTAMVLLLIAIYSADYILDTGYPWFLVLLLGSASGLLGVTYTGDMFNLFVMLEVTGISSYALVMYYMNRADSVLSGLKYAFIGALGTTLYLLAMGIVYSVFGTLNFVDFSLRIRTLEDGVALATVAYGLVMLISFWAFSIKSGVFPNHFWLPDAHPAAPTPISALLSGLVVNTGVIGLYKFFFIASWSTPENPLPHGMELARFYVSLLSIATGMVSAFIGGLLMFVQTDVKRLIAYSTVMNLGYLFMATGCLTTRGLSALAFYMVTHSIAKATLFLSAGVFIKAGGSRNLEKLAGLGMRLRLAGFSLAVSTLTLAGLPPLPGFLAKLLLYEALFEFNIGFAIAMVIASAIGLVSYMKLLYTVLFGVPITSPGEIKMPMARAVLGFLVVLMVALGVVFLFEPRLLEAVFTRTGLQMTVGIEEYVARLQKHILLLD